MKVDTDLEVDSRPALLRALVLLNAPDNLRNPFSLRTRTLQSQQDASFGKSAQEQGWNSDFLNVHVDAYGRF